MELRHEWKHEIGYGDLLALRSRLSAVLKRDIHAIDGRYQIRSLYFDDPRDRALREKLEGISRREKFRLRYYNGDTSLFLLEKKSKINGLCKKEQVQITVDEARLLSSGKVVVLDGGRDLLPIREKPLVEELYRKMHTQGLEPKTIVDYTREAFAYGPGNVRVTLDYNIRTGMGSRDFLNLDCVTVPAGDAPIILEVKWDEFLPSVVRDIVRLPGVHTAAFSKYAACRIYG